LPVYSGDEKNHDVIAAIDFRGRMNCACRVYRGYTCTITFPENCTYNDTCLLVLLGMFAENYYMAPLRNPKNTVEIIV